MKTPCRYLCNIAVPLVLSLSSALPARAESLWRDQESRSMISDRKAVAVGDIITILVQESSTATKGNNTSTAKRSGVDATISTFLYSPASSGFLTHGGQMPAMKFDGQTSFNGGGSIENKEQITAKIPVRIVDVLPNHNLVIEGTRHTSFGGEQQEIILRGMVRRDDVAANNTVFSSNIADATIKIVNKGVVSDSQRKGWLTKIWDVITPF